jgi:hypothetical protein
MLSRALKVAQEMKGDLFDVNLSGRGDKDVDTVRGSQPPKDTRIIETRNPVPSVVKSLTRIAETFAKLKRESHKGFILHHRRRSGSRDHSVDN